MRAVAAASIERDVRERLIKEAEDKSGVLADGDPGCEWHVSTDYFDEVISTRRVNWIAVDSLWFFMMFLS